MKKTYSFLERGKSVSEDVKIMVSKSMATVKEIYAVLDKKKLSQRDLALLLNKHESEISKWLSGTHNFTYSTISKIEAALGEKIIITASCKEKAAKPQERSKKLAFRLTRQYHKHKS